jgi:hypothetical protein
MLMWARVSVCISARHKESENSSNYVFQYPILNIGDRWSVENKNGLNGEILIALIQTSHFSSQFQFSTINTYIHTYIHTYIQNTLQQKHSSTLRHIHFTNHKDGERGWCRNANEGRDGGHTEAQEWQQSRAAAKEATAGAGECEEFRR